MDGEFDFNPSKSRVIKLSQKQAQNLSFVLSTNTVVRQKGKSSKFNEELFKGLFENGSNLIINAKPHSEEQINYSLKDLLNNFNTESKETILNTDYTTVSEK